MFSDEIDPFENPWWYLPYENLLGKNYRELLDNFTSKYQKQPFDRVKAEDPPDWNGFVTFSATPDYSDLVDVLKLSRDEVRKFWTPERGLHLAMYLRTEEMQYEVKVTSLHWRL